MRAGAIRPHAYRMLDNERCDWREIIEAHGRCTLQRMTGLPVVLCLHDTTELDFNGQTIEGLGPLSYEAQRGMYLHPTYAVSTDREPLGVLDAWMWARQLRDAHGQRGGICESTRWIERTCWCVRSTTGGCPMGRSCGTRCRELSRWARSNSPWARAPDAAHAWCARSCESSG